MGMHFHVVLHFVPLRLCERTIFFFNPVDPIQNKEDICPQMGADLENRYEPSIDWQLAILYQGLAEPLPLSQFCRDFSDSYDGLPLRIPETERSSSINGQ